MKQENQSKKTKKVMYPEFRCPCCSQKTSIEKTNYYKPGEINETGESKNGEQENLTDSILAYTENLLTDVFNDLIENTKKGGLVFNFYFLDLTLKDIHKELNKRKLDGEKIIKSIFKNCFDVAFRKLDENEREKAVIFLAESDVLKKICKKYLDDESRIIF